MHAGAIAPVRRDRDVEDHTVQPRIVGIARADRRILGQIDNALMGIAEHQLALRAQHAVGVLAADIALRKREIGARNIGAGRGEHGLHAGPRIGRTAHDLDRIAIAGIDHAHAELVGIGVLVGRNHPGNDEIVERLALILHALDLEPDPGERVGDVLRRGVGIEVILQPVERELHW